MTYFIFTIIIHIMKKLTLVLDITTHGSGKIIAKLAGVSQATISQIRLGRKRPSPNLAKRLEEITGIPHDVWLYPEEFKNPFVKKKGVKR